MNSDSGLAYLDRVNVDLQCGVLQDLGDEWTKQLFQHDAASSAPVANQPSDFNSRASSLTIRRPTAILTSGLEGLLQSYQMFVRDHDSTLRIRDFFVRVLVL